MFKVGDRVEINTPDEDEYHGLLGEIIRLMDIDHTVASHRVLLDNGETLYFETKELAMPKAQFKIGDRVKIMRPGNGWDNTHGKIIQLGVDEHRILIDGGIGYWVQAKELVLQSNTFKVGDHVQGQKFDNQCRGIITQEANKDGYYEMQTGPGLCQYHKAEDLRLVSQIEFTASEACKACKGTGKIELLTSYVDCDCVLAHTE